MLEVGQEGIDGGANLSVIGQALIDGVERRPGEITIYDGTGLALQDLAAASLVIAAAERLGGAQTITF